MNVDQLDRFASTGSYDFLAWLFLAAWFYVLRLLID